MSGFILSLEIPRGQNFPSPFLCPCLSHFCRNPMLELFCWWKLAAEDKGVETGFVNNGHLLCSSKGITFRYPLVFLCNMVSKSFTWICISQSFCYILTYEPWFPWDFNSSQLTELWVIEHCWGSVGESASERWGDILDPHLYFCLVPCPFVTHPHSPGGRDVNVSHSPLLVNEKLPTFSHQKSL